MPVEFEYDSPENKEKKRRALKMAKQEKHV